MGARVNGTVECFDAELPHGITLSCRAAGPREAPRALLLHGFPEGAFIWDEVMLQLSASVRCVAPNLRGYERSSAPADVAAYKTRPLLADLVALIEELGAPIDLLVAHDWGGAVAWSLAARQPHLLRHLLVVNAPHPATFLRELRDNPAQRAASQYMNFLCRPDAAALLAEHDFARLWPFFERMGGRVWLDAPMRERYRALWRHGLDGALNYYRASPLRPPTTPGAALDCIELPREAVTVHVPTTVLWGEADMALPVALLDGLDAYVPTLEIQRVAAASHWIVHEQPVLVAQAILRALFQPGAGSSQAACAGPARAPR
jgi:pimeloyl-ACP methyl ester carboxylesterase